MFVKNWQDWATMTLRVMSALIFSDIFLNNRSRTWRKLRAASIRTWLSKRWAQNAGETAFSIHRHLSLTILSIWLTEQKAKIKFDKLTPLTDNDYASIQVSGRGRTTKVVFNANVQRHVKAWEAYRDRLSSITLLDPACGSGAFLNEVFDFLYREGQAVNAALETLYGGQVNLFRWD